jgi:hypothetical protein
MWFSLYDGAVKHHLSISIPGRDVPDHCSEKWRDTAGADITDDRERITILSRGPLVRIYRYHLSHDANIIDHRIGRMSTRRRTALSVMATLRQKL